MPHAAKKVELLGTNRLLNDFFKVDEVRVSFQKFDGSMSGEQRLLVFERGDAVAALLFDPDRRKVILTNQFRLPTREKGSGRGWLLEAAAGMIRKDETPEECLLREVQEETGFQISEATPIATFFSSPGGSTERVFLYCAEVRRADRTAKGGGVAQDGEDIEIVEMDMEEFFKRLVAREFEDPKLIIAGLWLKERRAKLPAESNANQSRTIKFALKAGGGRIIGIKTGGILAIKDVDVWVNSENTDMMMDRFFGRSVSAAIRYHGAKKHEDHASIEEDTIGLALAKALGNRNFVAPATVIDTTAGELSKSNNVKRVFHVAAVQGFIGTGLSTTTATLESCVNNVLDSIGRARKYRSVLLPVLATGQGGFLVKDVAPLLVARAVDFLEANPSSRLKEVYFVAYSVGDKEILEDVLLGINTIEQVL